MPQEQYFVCRFSQDPQGRWGYKTPFHGLPVSLDRANTIEPVFGREYLVEVTSILPGRRRFVRIIDDVLDIFLEVQPFLLVATWQRPDHVTDEPRAEIDHPKYGQLTAKFYRPTGGRMRRSFVQIAFCTSDGDQQSFTVEDDTYGRLTELGRRVHQCVGPAVNLAAAISRQSDNPRSNRW